MKRPLRNVLWVAVAIAAFGLGRCSMRSLAPDPAGGSAAGAEVAVTWTCPMHPQIRRPEPGSCPVCGMDLVAMSAAFGGAGAGVDERVLELSPAAAALAEIETAPVERRHVAVPVRMVGKVDLDETRVRTISARVAGRLDRLFVDYTGVSVRPGDHLVWLYSPDLQSAQESLLSALRRFDAAGESASTILRDSDRLALEAARDKLLLWGLTADQVAEIEARGTSEDHVMLTSPVGGVVIEKLLEEGAYVETGTRVYTIADLSQLWVRLDAYEQDLAWLHHGQTVRIGTEAWAGETFEGRITFIAPVVDEATRTVKVRVNVDNSDGRLKPGMFVRAVAEAPLTEDGRVLEPALAGKWISPMHPEIVKDEPGTCDVCGMALVPAEELGFVTDASASEPPLVVPVTAVLRTGQRAVVYVADPTADHPVYEGREIVLGPRAGDHYVVRSGLAEGERVVVNGAFRIDSAMQIRAKPSMMSMRPAGSDPHAGHDHALDEEGDVDPDAAEREPLQLGDDARAALDRAVTAYLDAQRALAADDAAAAASALERLAREAGTLSKVEALRGPAGVLGALGADGDVESLRSSFRAASEVLIPLVEHTGGADRAVALVHCPMAFDFEGADWLQEPGDVQNPYFGAAMLTCGTERRRLEARE